MVAVRSAAWEGGRRPHVKKTSEVRFGFQRRKLCCPSRRSPVVCPRGRRGREEVGEKGLSISFLEKKAREGSRTAAILEVEGLGFSA